MRRLKRAATYSPLLVVLLLSLIIAAPAQQRTGAAARRIRFEPGCGSVLIQGPERFGSLETYIFHARRGQTITARVEWSGARVGADEQLSGYAFVMPDGTSYEDAQDDHFTAEETGDSRVVLRTRGRLSSPRYTFTLTIG